MRCPGCGANNRPGMAFCYECGETLDATAPTEATPTDASGGVLDRFASREVRLGLALVLIVVVVAVVLGWQDAQHAALGRLYTRGQTALAAGDKAQALDLFIQAGDYADAPAQVARLTPEVATLKAQYEAGVQAAVDHRWWDATRALDAAADIQISYQDVNTRLREARIQSGPLFYRRAGPDGAVKLWWAQADGHDPHPLPSSDAHSVLLAVAPDGSAAVYGGPPDAPAPTIGPFFVDLTTDAVTSLAQKYRTLATLPWVRFQGDSRGFWWGDDTQTFYYDRATGSALPLSEPPGAFDAAHARLLLSRLLVPTINQTVGQLLLSDPLGHKHTPLPAETGEVSGASFSDDGRYLLYTLRPPAVPDGRGGQVTTATLVLNDLAAPEAPVRIVLWTQPIKADVALSDTVRAAFLPGGDSIYAWTTTGTHWAIRAWTGTEPSNVLATDAALAPGQTLLQLSPVDASHLALTFGGASSGPADLALVALDGTWTQVAEGLPLGRWLAFSPDGRQALISRAFSGKPSSPRSVAPVALPPPGLDAAGPWLVTGVLAGPAGADPIFTRDSRRILILGNFGGQDGLYAVQVEGSDPVLVVAGATAFWPR